MYPEPLFPQIPHQEKKAFLAAFAHCGRITRAAEAAHVHWRSHYHWLKQDPQYAAAFAQAKEMAGDFLEDEAIRRAMEGVTRKVFHQGEHVDNEQVLSDTLLIFLLKGAKPEKYRDAAPRDDRSEVSALLKAVLLELAERQPPRDVTPEAEWAPLPPTTRQEPGARAVLPPPPAVEED